MPNNDANELASIARYIKSKTCKNVVLMVRVRIPKITAHYTEDILDLAAWCWSEFLYMDVIV